MRSLGHVASGDEEREKNIYDESPSLCIPRQRIVSMMVRLSIWDIEGLSHYK